MIACNSTSTVHVLLPARSFQPKARSSFSPQEALILLQKCANFEQMKLIHARIIRNSLHQHQVIVARLIRLCSSYRELDYAALVFEHVESPSTFVWNLLIRTYTVNDDPHRAILLYNSMIFRGVSVDKFTFPFVMKACLAIYCVQKAKEVYGFAVKTGFSGDVYLDNVLIDLYVKCGALVDAMKVFDKMRYRSVVSWTTIVSGLALNGRMDTAQQVFDKMPSKNVVSWTAMINGYAKSEKPEMAFELYKEMQRHNVKPNEYTLVALLTASAALQSLKLGRWVHDFAIRNGFEIGVFVGTSLIDMYSKCGSLEHAKLVFEEMENKSVATWNSMITSLGVHGQAEEAIARFLEMERRNLKPDAVTFAGVLSACLQTGNVDNCRRYFYYMVECYGMHSHMAKLLDLEASNSPTS